MKMHQSRIVDAVTIPQKIPVSPRLAQFAVKTHVRHDLLLGRLLTIGEIRHVIDTTSHFGEYRAFAVAR
jgi:hypothetical protein